MCFLGFGSTFCSQRDTYKRICGFGTISWPKTVCSSTKGSCTVCQTAVWVAWYGVRQVLDLCKVTMETNLATNSPDIHCAQLLHFERLFWSLKSPFNHNEFVLNSFNKTLCNYVKPEKRSAVKYLYLSLYSGAVHPARHVHRVSPNVVLRSSSSNHSCNHRSNIDTWN